MGGAALFSSPLIHHPCSSSQVLRLRLLALWPVWSKQQLCQSRQPSSTTDGQATVCEEQGKTDQQRCHVHSTDSTGGIPEARRDATGKSRARARRTSRREVSHAGACRRSCDAAPVARVPGVERQRLAHSPFGQGGRRLRPRGQLLGVASQVRKSWTCTLLPVQYSLPWRRTACRLALAGAGTFENLQPQPNFRCVLECRGEPWSFYETTLASPRKVRGNSRWPEAPTWRKATSRQSARRFVATAASTHVGSKRGTLCQQQQQRPWCRSLGLTVSCRHTGCTGKQAVQGSLGKRSGFAISKGCAKSTGCGDVLEVPGRAGFLRSFFQGQAGLLQPPARAYKARAGHGLFPHVVTANVQPRAGHVLFP